MPGVVVVNQIAAQSVDADGNPVAADGSTQYTEGAVATSITGTAALMEVAGSTLLPLQGSLADGLLVNLGSNNDVTGTITANAGANLNTSLLALESGGNLSSALTSLQLIDDAIYTDGTGSPAKGILIMGTDGANPQAILTDGYGIQTISGNVILSGTNHSGVATLVPVTQDGHLEVEIHGPLLPFGSVHAEKLTPVFQMDGVYQINPEELYSIVSGTGAAGIEDSMMKVSTGTTVNSASLIASRKIVRYRPGQGVVGRFAGMFTAGVAGSVQTIGFGHAEDGFHFGYNGTAFGILHRRGGIRELQTLAVTVASTTAESITITLAGVAFPVMVTNSASTIKTAYEISIGTYAGWRAQQRGSTVIFLADLPGDKVGTFSLAGSTAVGTFVETLAGAAPTDSWIPQTSWNGDKLDGLGASAATLDPTKGNTYQISVQYLGFGPIIFYIGVISPGRNDPSFLPVHVLKYSNLNTVTSVSNPSFAFMLDAHSEGGTTNVSTHCSSCGGFIEGDKKLVGPRGAYYAQSSGVGATNYQALITIRNDFVYAGKSNLSVINLVSIGGALKHTQPCTIFLIRNGILAGTPNFIQHSISSTSYVDVAATTVTFSDNTQLLFSLPLGEAGQIWMEFNEEMLILPGETITIAAKSSQGTPAYVLCSLNTREDQ